MFSLLVFVFFLVLYSQPILSQWVSSPDSRGQYISYSGLISGHYRHSQAQIARGCPDYNLGPHNRSYLYIGQFPFDSNPFFFEIYHYASNTTNGGYFTYTNDSIYNLDFTSVGYPCMKDGALCGSLVFSPWYYVVAEILDLGIGTGQRKAVVERVQENGATGYKVSGDQTSFISNGTIENHVTVAYPWDLGYKPGCLYSEQYVWNSSVPFTYNLTFTQTFASMSLYIATTQGALTLSFNGTMVDSDLQLLTTDPNVPKFNTTFQSSGGRKSPHVVSLKFYAIGILGICLLT